MSDMEKLQTVALTEPLAQAVFGLMRIGCTKEEAILKGLLTAIEENRLLREQNIELLQRQPARPLLVEDKR